MVNKLGVRDMTTLPCQREKGVSASYCQGQLRVCSPDKHEPNEPVIPGLYMSKYKAKQKGMISSENYRRAYNTRKVHLSLCALVVPWLDPRRGLRHWRDDGRL